VFKTEFEGVIGDGIEDCAGAEFKFFAGGDVISEGGTGDKERAEGGELDEIEGRDGTAGAAEEDQGSAGRRTSRDFSKVVLPTES
jgi:hypothetical protein